MAHKQHAAKEPPPSAKHVILFNSDDEDDGEEDGFFSSNAKQTQKQQPRAPSQSDGFGTSDDDDDGSSTDVDTPKTFSTKPLHPTVGSPPPPPPTSILKSLTKPKQSDAGGKQRTVSAPITPAKRPAEDSNPGYDDEEEQPAKKQLFARVWTEADEVALLNFLLQCRKRGKDPFSDMLGFWKHVHKSLSFDCQQQQLVTKIRRLKKKFEKSIKRIESGKEPTSGKPHDKAVFELGRKIWGSSRSDPVEVVNHVNGEESIKKDDKNTKASTLSVGKASNRVKSDEKSSEVLDTLAATVSTPGGGGRGREYSSWVMQDLCMRGTTICEEMVRKGVSLMDADQAEEYDRKWKELKMAEMKMTIRRSELVKGHIEAIMEALKR